MTEEQRQLAGQLARAITQYGDSQFMLAIAATRGTNQECFDAITSTQIASRQTEMYMDKLIGSIERNILTPKDVLVPQGG